MTSPSSPEILLSHLNWTLQRFDEILKREKTPYYRSAALQRFGLTYEMTMKCLQAICKSNASCEVEKGTDWQELTEAYDKIRQLLKNDREESEQQKSVEEIYHRLSRYQVIFQRTYNYLYSLINSQRL